jgi:pimeloyl-ACP methyl ester carboxylesterase
MMREGALPIAKIRAPTFVLWGRHDPVLQYAWTDRLGDYFETLTLECAEDAGHFVHFEVPELANERIIQFLS